MLLAIPLLAIPLALYNALAFTQGDIWRDVVFEVAMVRGAVFSLTAGGVLVGLALVFLFFEVLKATRTGAGSITDHLMSILVFIVALVEFLLVDLAATETFFLIMVMVLIDVAAGFSISIRGARRDVGFDPSGF